MALGFWAAAFVVIYGAALVLTSFWPSVQFLGDTLILVALAGACFVNFGRNRTLHCGISGPIFLLGAVAAGLIEAGAWRLEIPVVWIVVLLGVCVAFAIEWRTVGPNGSSRACRMRKG